ncbi:hypothetical protein, partial [Rhizobium sp. Pop5]|uniref:hypothetical protein n=1 Tax=Rhizobium sp. Pop5 TaxID=1223565 RepID=UPI0002839029
AEAMPAESTIAQSARKPDFADKRQRLRYGGVSREDARFRITPSRNALIYFIKPRRLSEKNDGRRQEWTDVAY